MPTTAEIKLNISVQDRGGNVLTGGPRFNVALEYLQKLTDGTGANNLDLAYVDERSVNASTDDNIDLIGSLSTALGVAFDAAEIVAIVIINAPFKSTDPANVSDLTIGGATNPFIGFLGATHTIGPIKPGGAFMLAAGDAAGIGTVTAATADILRIANGAGGTAKYKIAILARSS